jgi:oxygen-independent coproporphyrinogen-3 oxidase
MTMTDPGELDRSERSVTDERWEGSYFVSTYPPFSCWDSASVPEVNEVLQGRGECGPELPFGLYVHIPFCVQRCNYCYYLSSVDWSAGSVDRYLETVVRELSLYSRLPRFADRRPAFVYFGGGTPSVLSPAQICSFLSRLQAVLPWEGDAEVTFECAPASVTDSKVHALHENGVTRLSLGVQQLNDAVLAANGRVHREQDVQQAFAAARQVDFDIVNLDLMVGLIGETDQSFDQSLERIVEMAPDSVTIYQLEVPRNTPLYHSVLRGEVCPGPPPWPMKRSRLKRGLARLEAAGFALRSAYAATRPGKQRFLYQDLQYRGADLLGIGASAFSYVAGVHFQNLVPIGDYGASLQRDEPAVRRAHRMTAEERLVREFVLQLKLGEVDTAQLGHKFDVDVRARFAEVLTEFASAGWLQVHPGAIVLTRDGLLRVDRMIRSFYLPQHRGIPYS